MTVALASLNLKNDSGKKINCLIRKEFVAATPEELVRQNFIRRMLLSGYPLSYIALEKALSQMPHLALSQHVLPNRRADIVCFAQHIHPKYELYPLLVVECKAVALSAKVINQVLGYNYYLQACFVSIVNGQEVRTGWFDSTAKQYRFVDYLPSYAQLLKSARKNGSR